jgi:hypothetical protein
VVAVAAVAAVAVEVVVAVAVAAAEIVAIVGKLSFMPSALDPQLGASSGARASPGN